MRTGVLGPPRATGPCQGGCGLGKAHRPGSGLPASDAVIAPRCALPAPRPLCLSFPVGNGRVLAALQVTHPLPGLDRPRRAPPSRGLSSPRRPRAPPGSPRGGGGAGRAAGRLRGAPAGGRGGAGGGDAARLPLPRLLPPPPPSWSAAPEGGGGRRREPREEPPPPPRHGARVSARGPARPRTTWRRRRRGCCCWRSAAAWPPPRVGGRGPRGQWPGGQVRGARRRLCKLGASWGARRGCPPPPAARGPRAGPLSRPPGPLPGRPGPVPRPGPARRARGRRRPRQVRRGRVLTCPRPGARSEVRPRVAGRARPRRDRVDPGRRAGAERGLSAQRQASPPCVGDSAASPFPMAARRAPRTDLSCRESSQIGRRAAWPVALPSFICEAVGFQADRHLPGARRTRLAAGPPPPPPRRGPGPVSTPGVASWGRRAG